MSLKIDLHTYGNLIVIELVLQINAEKMDSLTKEPEYS